MKLAAPRLALVASLAAMAIGLGYAVLTLPAHSSGLGESVTANLHASGATNPVTAVLLNFRGYDTMLEMAVLLLALLGVWSFSLVAQPREAPAGPVLQTLSRLLVPLLILVAGYLLWVGAQAPGGAFQAGAILGAAGVLSILTGWRPDVHLVGLEMRLALIAGLGTFLIVGTGLMFIGGQLLQFPPSYAGALILLIEAGCTLSIGITLAALFLGGRPTGAPPR